MTLWFALIAGALTLAAVAVLVWPLIRGRRGEAAPGEHDQAQAVYRDQLAELERDLMRGALDVTQAQAARLEISRRLLATADAADRGGQTDPAPARGNAGRLLLALGLALLLPAGAVLIYLPLGRPNLPSQPFAARTQIDPGVPAEVRTAVDQLARRLQKEPNNLGGWMLLGQSYLRLGEDQRAVEAFAQAVTLSGGDPGVTTWFGEAVVVAAKGVVTKEAKDAFESVIAASPEDPRARFYLALAKAQAGDNPGAIAGWSALVKDSPANAPWLPMVQSKITEAGGTPPEPLPAITAPEPKDNASGTPAPAEGSQPAAPPAAAPPPAAPAEGATAPAPAAPGASGEQPSPEDAQRMIRSMVEGLASKLKADPANIDGWLRLAQSYQVLGQPGPRLEALRQAVANGPNRADAHLALAEALLDGVSPETTSPLPADAVAELRIVLTADPDQRHALWYLGLDAANGGRKDEAIALWQHLLKILPSGNPNRAEVESRLEKLKL